MNEDPFRIFALPHARALGDFIIQNIVAASLKSNFENSRLFVYYRDDRDYKNLIIESNIYIDYKINTKGTKGSFPIDLFDQNSGRPIHSPDREFYEKMVHRPDLIISPATMNAAVLNTLPNTPRFAFPERHVSVLTERLREHGVSPDRWFCIMHCRDESYPYRPGNDFRDMPHADFIAVARLIVDELGGQVVRVGHPGMRQFPKMSGLLDLSRVPDSFALQ
ncbi:MAG: hypothetical protein HOH65_07620, partial [Rhodospirillaceae bacterium]|nr:hypothetical protein [Rhodospirillaceae bacterium]